MIMKTLDKLLNQGWKTTNRSNGDCEIYKRDNGRILYNRNKDSVELEYTTDNDTYLKHYEQ